MLLQAALAKQGLSVFFDETNLRAGDRWLDELQKEVRSCGAFVVLVGRDGVTRWLVAETQAALIRHFSARDDGERLPIFPVLLDGSVVETLPAFLQQIQATPWDGTSPPDELLLAAVRDRRLRNREAKLLDGSPFVGLAAFQSDQAHLFFGRQKETFEALDHFETRAGQKAIRWLQIEGISGSGKSSLMRAGLLPLIDQSWLWPRTGYKHWRCIGPMLPGERPVEMLAESLAHEFKGARIADLVKELALGDDRLRYWLRERKADNTAFLLAIDQFEELLTVAEVEQRTSFDRLLASALDDPECPLFMLSTVRTDFLDRFVEALPRLVGLKNRKGKAWTLEGINEARLCEVIDGPARLAGLDVREVREVIIDQARGETGALPLVENALGWLWEKRENGRLIGQKFRDQGGLAGLLCHSADNLLNDLGQHRDQALELLFRLVRVDPEGGRHALQRIGCDEAVAIAGGGEAGLEVVNRLSGQRKSDGGRAIGPLRLITVDDDAVNLIHETLIRSRGLDAAGKPQPYWSTLWEYIEQHKERSALRQRLRSDMQTWRANGKAQGFKWSHERVRELYTVLQKAGPKFELDSEESKFIGPIDPRVMLDELQKPETDHTRRLLIGERLAVLGDPRRGVGVKPDGTAIIDWHSVPSGEVTISIVSEPMKWEAPVTDTKRKRVATFQIARYPITVDQYRAFIDAKDGWSDKAWWGRDLYRDDGGSTYPFGRYGNHPAAFVSWFDAVAFCRWLSQRLRFEVRLPTEWEWQQAATGGDDGYVFPWGPNWDPKAEPWLANTRESQLGQVTAVGMYPAGASPTGALDMGGTIWEWCLNKFDGPKFEVTQSCADDFDLRAMRGGSWNNWQGNADVGNRGGRNAPNFPYIFIGFRVVRPSPSTGVDF